MKILIFTEGTILMHSSGMNASREERVLQSRREDRSVREYEEYVPVGMAVEKINKWHMQGAEIYYLTSRREPELFKISKVLKKYGFPQSDNLVFRKENEHYGDVVVRVVPDILIEDDCESSDGEIDMTYPLVPKELQSTINHIVVKEFGGIANLSDRLE